MRRSSALPPLAARLGEQWVLAQAGGRDLCLPDPLASWVWDVWAAGWTETDIAAARCERFALTPDQALKDVRNVLACVPQETVPEPRPARRGLVPAMVAEPDASVTRWWLRVADQNVELAVADSNLAADLGPVFAHLGGPPHPRGTAHRLTLLGTAGTWVLECDGWEHTRGLGCDEALVQTLLQLAELGCDNAERLLVAHAAGVAHVITVPSGSICSQPITGWASPTRMGLARWQGRANCS